MELSVGGKNPLTLANNETRAFLEDGDTVTLRAYCEGEGFRRIGFGECTGTVLPAR
jgi:fumarylacetoacetase